VIYYLLKLMSYLVDIQEYCTNSCKVHKVWQDRMCKIYNSVVQVLIRILTCYYKTLLNVFGLWMMLCFIKCIVLFLF